jgi:uncharacterized protein (DUF1015 family)
MAEIIPFRAYRYNADKVDLQKVLTQPYDKISPAMQEKYYAASPYNLIVVEKGRSAPGDTPEDNVYTRAAQKLEEWTAEGILTQDERPAVYVYAQEFTDPLTSKRRTRTGMIALGRIEDYDAEIVHRHERTLAGPKADRLELLRHTRTQTGQLFMLYEDESGGIDRLLNTSTRKPATVEIRDEYDVLHRLWLLTDDAVIKRITAALADKKLVIADGHHRYETALAFRNELRESEGTADAKAPFEFAMMTLFNTQAKDLLILPTHRVVRDVKDFNFEKLKDQDASRYFDWFAYPFTNAGERPAAYAEFKKDLAARGRSGNAIGVYAGAGAFYLFALRRDADLEKLVPDVPAPVRELDVVLLHRLLLEKGLGITPEAVTAELNVTYVRGMDEALAVVDSGEAQIAFLLNPVEVQEVADIALGGDVMPQKSTDFYPKLLSGIANYRY